MQLICTLKLKHFLTQKRLQPGVCVMNHQISNGARFSFSSADLILLSNSNKNEQLFINLIPTHGNNEHIKKFVECRMKI